MLTYGGVGLIAPTEGVEDWVRTYIDQHDVAIWAYRSWPGTDLTNIAFPTGFVPVRPIRLNRLYWPTGASRWGYGHFLCDTDGMTQIKKLALGTKCNKNTKLLLAMDDGYGGKMSTNLYLAKYQPLTGIRNTNGLYMLSLVCPRYYWWNIPTPDFQITSDTQWTDLFQDIQTAIGQSVSYDTPDYDYLKPDTSLNLTTQPLPIVFDAIAYNVGMRVIYGLDGKIRVWNYDTSLKGLNANLNITTLQPRAGDQHFGEVL